MAVLMAIGFVDKVVIFDEPTPLKLIQNILPDAIVKGGDWKAEEVAGSDICPVHLFKCIDSEDGKKYSTTDILERANRPKNIIPWK